MKLNVKNIPEEGITYHISKNDDWFAAMVPADREYRFSVADAFVECAASKIGTTVALRGTIKTAIHLECCRCLKNFTLAVNANFKYTFVPVENLPKNDELELTGEDLGFGYYKDDTIDIDPIILEQVILQIPMKPLCKDSCRGLCPQCGIDLNEDSCNHHKEIFESPFAALKKLKIKNADNGKN